LHVFELLSTGITAPDALLFLHEPRGQLGKHVYVHVP